jgi:hypothetical protein
MKQQGSINSNKHTSHNRQDPKREQTDMMDQKQEWHSLKVFSFYSLVQQDHFVAVNL